MRRGRCSAHHGHGDNQPGNGRRRTRQITLDELLVLACVLKVPPILLFLPLNDGERLEITPAISTDPVPSALWLSGLIASPNMPDIADDDQSLRWANSPRKGSCR